MKFGLSENTIAEIRSVFEKHPAVEWVKIYGSRALGTHRPGSDIDLAVAGISLEVSDIWKIGAALDDLEMLYTFDVLLYHKLKNQELKNHIDRVGREIYHDKVQASEN